VSPLQQAYIAGLLSQALASMAVAEAENVVLQLMVFGKVPRELLLGCLRLSGGVLGQELFQRTADMMSKAVGMASTDAAERLRETLGRLEAIPNGVLLADMEFPSMIDSWVAEGFESRPVGGGSAPHPLESCPIARELCAHHDRYALAAEDSSSSSVLDYWDMSGQMSLAMLWGGFHASGDPALLRRVCDAYVPWAEALASPHMTADVEMALLADSDAPLPQELREDDAKWVRLTCALSAARQLLNQSQFSSRVTSVVAEEVRDLAESVPRRVPLNDATRRRLQTLPKLLHLIARSALERA
jgi:hypothetical protein